MDDEDEVLEVLAVQIGLMGEFVGGVDFIHLLLNPLETLCAAEQSRVRDKVWDYP
jgi:serine/threonine-protein phosphatase 2A regulatory subunit A